MRECAEAQSKDFGLIATEKGWNLYVCGNGGAKPRHADLLAADLDEDTLHPLHRSLPHVLHPHRRPADAHVGLARQARRRHRAPARRRHRRRARHLRRARARDAVAGRHATAASGRRSSTIRRSARAFRQFVNIDETDRRIEFVARARAAAAGRLARASPVAARTEAAPADADAAAGCRVAQRRRRPARRRHRASSTATRSSRSSTSRRAASGTRRRTCARTRSDLVLARGIDRRPERQAEGRLPAAQEDVRARLGQCLSGDDYAIATFPVKVDGGHVYVELPPAQQLEAALCAHAGDHEHAVRSMPRSDTRGTRSSRCLTAASSFGRCRSSTCSSSSAT